MRSSVWRRLLQLAAMVALVPAGSAPAAAQSLVATLDELRRELAPGDRVLVVRAQGDSVEGRLVEFGDTHLDISGVGRVKDGKPGPRRNLTIPLSTLRSLDRPPDSANDGALIGAGIGGGSVLAMFIYALAVDRNELDEWGPTYLALGGVSTGVGALVGWAIDRAHSKRHIRFARSATGAVRIRVMPRMIGGTGIGIAVSY